MKRATLILCCLLIWAAPARAQTQPTCLLPWRDRQEKERAALTKEIAELRAQLQRNNDQLLAILQQQKLAPAPVPAPPQIFIVPGGPNQALPVEPKPRQDLPVEPKPKQDLPVEPKPRQEIPVEPKPKQELPGEPKPRQALPLPGESKPLTPSPGEAKPPPTGYQRYSDSPPIVRAVWPPEK